MSGVSRRQSGKSGSARGARRWLGALAAALALMCGGMVYRVAAPALRAGSDVPITLESPLSTLPLVMGDWEGEDVSLSEGVQRTVQNDDFINRRYRNTVTGDTVSVYLGYTARPRTMLRHRPTVCYASAGWLYLGTKQVVLDGEPRDRPALVHAFLKPGLSETRNIVLNYYVLNGRHTIDEHSFWGLNWRGPNSRRDPSRYVAQVQIAAAVSSASLVERAEVAVRNFAVELAPRVSELLPETDVPLVVRDE